MKLNRTDAEAADGEDVEELENGCVCIRNLCVSIIMCMCVCECIHTCMCTYNIVCICVRTTCMCACVHYVCV